MREPGVGKATAVSKHREMLHKRVEELTQPIAEHEIAELDLDTRQGFTPRTGSIVMLALLALAVIVGGIVGFRVLTTGSDESAGSSAHAGGTHALSVPTTSAENSGETAGSGETEGAAPHERATATEKADSGIIVVSVQGMVAHPGLLRVKSDLRVGDVIVLAGPAHPRAQMHGLNLAQQVADGMQIVVDSAGSRLVMPVAAGGADPSSPDATPADPSSSGSGTGGTTDSDSHARSASGAATPSGGQSNGKININTADQAALETLNGVGPSTAKAIVEWRKTNGKFRSVEQLMEVRGIGPAKFAAMKGSVTV